MNEAETRLEYSNHFGDVLITTDRIRGKYHLPPALFLDMMNTLAEGNDSETPSTLETKSGKFLVGLYKPMAEYDGHTTYRPRFNILELPEEGEGAELFVTVDASDRPYIEYGHYRGFDRLNPSSDSQYGYKLIGSTWTPRDQVPKRQAEHASLQRFGSCLVDKIGELSVDKKDLKHYRAYIMSKG